MLHLNIQFVEGLQTTSKKFDYDMSVDFPSQFQEICKLFEIPEIRREKHALQLHSFSGEYIDTTSKITETTFGSESRVDVFLKLKPAIQAREIIEVIHDNDKVAQGKVLFKLKDTMQDPSFAEEFIENDGIAILSTFINRSKGNLQAYCLAGLRAALVYVSAMNVISDSPRIVGEIYNLTDTTQEYGLTIYKNALELLLVFVSYLENGLALVKEAAKESISKTKTKEPYENFMHLLRSGDLDVQVNTLAVMNIMLSKSKTEEKKKKLIFQWEKVELRPILKGLNESEYPAIKDQLHILQKISNYSIPRSWYESEKYKKEWERMTVKYEQTQEKLFEYQRQQPLIKLMRAELSRCHETLEMMSIQCGYLPKSYPTSRIGDRSGDLIAGEVIDLSMYDKMELELSSEYEMLQKTRRELVHRFMSNREFNNLIPSRKPTVVQRKQSIKPSDPFDSSDDEEEGKDERISPEITLEMQKLRDKVKELQERLERQAHFVHEEDDYVPPPPPPDFDGDDFIPPMTGSQVTTEPATKTPTNQQIGSNKTTNITMAPEVSVSSPSSTSSPPPPIIIGGTVPSSSNGMIIGAIPPPPMGGNIPPPPPMNGSGIPPPISGMPLLSPITGSIPPPTPMAGMPPPSPMMGSIMPPLPPMMSGLPPPPPPMGGIMSSPPPMSGMPPPPPPMMGGMLPPMMSGPPPPPMMGGGMPPPPMMGGMPPPMMGGMPPPMMGGFRPGGFGGPGQPTKPKIVPQRKMKGLFWDRILTNTPQGAGTIWTGVKEGEFDMKEFESMFAKREAPPTAKRVEKKEVAPENAPLIDAKLFQNLSIMLRKLPKPAKLQQAILELDSKSLSKDQIDIIIQNMPTNEDMKEFKDKYKNKPMKNFTEAEKYMLMIITIPEFATRLDCWVFMHEFENNVSTMISPLDSMKKAIELIKNNKDFPYLLGYLLSMGNYLNGDTPKGQADGFHLKVLPKIDATKDKTNKISLLQYAIDTAVSSRPDLVNMSDDLKIVHEIKGTSLDSLTKGIGTIAAGFNKFKAQVKKVKEHVDDDDPFMKIATQFYNDSRKKCDQIELGLAAVKKEYHALLKYYAYKDQEIEKTETTEFFGIISEFLLKFDKCIQATKAEQLKNQKKNQASQKKGQTITSAGKGEDAMSKMVNKIKSDLLNN